MHQSYVDTEVETAIYNFNFYYVLATWFATGKVMGSSTSKDEEKNEDVAEVNNENGGVHLIEVHFGTAGFSIVSVIIILLVVAVILACVRKYCKRGSRSLLPFVAPSPPASAPAPDNSRMMEMMLLSNMASQRAPVPSVYPSAPAMVHALPTPRVEELSHALARLPPGV